MHVYAFFLHFISGMILEFCNQNLGFDIIFTLLKNRLLVLVIKDFQCRLLTDVEITIVNLSTLIQKINIVFFY